MRGWSGTVFPRKKKAGQVESAPEQEEGAVAEEEGQGNFGDALPWDLAEDDDERELVGGNLPANQNLEAAEASQLFGAAEDEEHPKEEDEEPPKKKKRSQRKDKDNKDTEEKSKEKEKSEKPKKEPKKKRHCTETLLIKLFYLQPEPDEWAQIPIGPVKFVREKLPNCLEVSKIAETFFQKKAKKEDEDPEAEGQAVKPANTAGASGKQTEPIWAEVASHLTD